MRAHKNCRGFISQFKIALKKSASIFDYFVIDLQGAPDTRILYYATTHIPAITSILLSLTQINQIPKLVQNYSGASGII